MYRIFNNGPITKCRTRHHDSTMKQIWNRKRKKYCQYIGHGRFLLRSSPKTALEDDSSHLHMSNHRSFVLVNSLWHKKTEKTLYLCILNCKLHFQGRIYPFYLAIGFREWMFVCFLNIWALCIFLPLPLIFLSRKKIKKDKNKYATLKTQVCINHCRCKLNFNSMQISWD